MKPLNPLLTTTVQIEFEKKCIEVMIAVGTIQCTGTVEGEDGTTYSYTEAAHVFKEYREAFINAGLTIRPFASPEMKPELTTAGRNTTVLGYYKITDATTGYYEISWGIGIGLNAFWAANTAQTLAMKQCLLNCHLADWPQPPEYKETCKAELRQFNLSTASADEVVEKMGEFFSKKGDQNE